MRKTLAAMMLVAMTVMVGAGGGCEVDQAPMDRCDRKAIACQNSCYKADTGPGCFSCCQDNASACKADAGYSFYSCPDK